MEDQESLESFSGRCYRFILEECERYFSYSKDRNLDGKMILIDLCSRVPQEFITRLRSNLAASEYSEKIIYSDGKETPKLTKYDENEINFFSINVGFFFELFYRKKEDILLFQTERNKSSEGLEDKIKVELDGSLSRVIGEYSRRNLKGIILGGHVQDYSKYVKAEIESRGILVEEESFDERERVYRNGEGWMRLDVKFAVDTIRVELNKLS